MEKNLVIITGKFDQSTSQQLFRKLGIKENGKAILLSFLIALSEEFQDAEGGTEVVFLPSNTKTSASVKKLMANPSYQKVYMAVDQLNNDSKTKQEEVSLLAGNRFEGAVLQFGSQAGKLFDLVDSLVNAYAKRSPKQYREALESIHQLFEHLLNETKLILMHDSADPKKVKALLDQKMKIDNEQLLFPILSLSQHFLVKPILEKLVSQQSGKEANSFLFDTRVELHETLFLAAVADAY